MAALAGFYFSARPEMSDKPYFSPARAARLCHAPPAPLSPFTSAEAVTGHVAEEFRLPGSDLCARRGGQESGRENTI
jgi:hypothetical protein